MKRILLLLVLTVISAQNKAQNVSILPGEVTTIETGVVYNSDFGPSNTNGSGFSCNFNKGRGILSIGAEIQSDGYSSWDEVRVAFYYNGSWKEIFQLWGNDNQTGCDFTGGYNQQYYTTTQSPACNYTGTTYETNSTVAGATKIGKMGGGFSDRYQNITMKNMGNLQVYHDNFLPQTGVLSNRVSTTDNYMWGIQSRKYTASGTSYPCHNDPNPSTKKTTGYDVNNYKQFGNLEGFVYNQFTPDIGVIIINVANLPPDMLEAPNFKVHIYAKSNGNNHNRIYETTYSNQNFMTQGPNNLTASKNLCSKVTLNWSNSNNTLPDDGTVTLRNVIFRNGTYLATVAGTVTTYDDLTAVQDVDYSYTVRHVAFSETGETYYRSPATVAVTGSVKPSPDAPITPTASENKCNNKVDITWSYNGANPDKFRIDYATTYAGPYSTLTSTVTGSSRSYSHTGVTRGQQYYYRIYSINTCAVISTTYAECNGISPSDPTMATGITATTNTVTNTVTVEWNDNANNETKYEIVRTDDQGNTIYVQANPNDTLYVDQGVAACRQYTYKVRVFNDCVLSGITSTGSASATLPPPNLNSTFASPNYFTGSKGYFVNRVELKWSNGNNGVLDFIKILRKVLGSATPAVQIASVTPGTQIYHDNTADAGVFYQYYLVGEKYCLGTTYYTDTISDIGFRSATGIVNGHIDYTGGIAVEGAKVTLEPANGTTGKSMYVTPGNYGVVPNSTDFNFTNAMTIEAYVKIAASAANMGIVEKAGAFDLKFTSANNIVFGTTNGAYQSVSYNSAIDDGTWHHIASVYDGSLLKLFLDGNLVGTQVQTGNITINANNINIGNVLGSSMNIDEVRVYNVAKTDLQITQDYSRVMRGNENGLVAYYRFNEGAGAAFYDASYLGTTYNENHGAFTGSPAFNTSIPTAAQLSFAGYTNSNGDYTVPVAYNGNGEIFTATPYFPLHQFQPATQSMYIGDNSQIQNGINFTDISSFTVSGNVKYSPVTCVCPADGAFLKIDGNIVIQNGTAVTTDANGNFTIQVPIGNHYITVEKNGHIYSDTAGRFPQTGTWDFQAPVSGIQFLDSTFVKVIGKVVGGTREAEKPMIPGRSSNNIGQAKIRFETFNGCFIDSVLTDVLHGDYVKLLPPLKYKVIDLDVTNTASTTPNFATFLDPVFDLSQIDLINIPPVQTIVDTLFTSADHTTWSSIDSVSFQKIKSFIYRNSPAIWVKDSLGNTYHDHAGDTLLFYRDPLTDIVDTLNVPYGTYPFPVYREFQPYKFDVGVMEIYKDLSLGAVDSVPVTQGVVTINNGLAAGSVVTQFNLSDSTVNTTWDKDTCYYRYRFICGKPNIAYTAGSPNNFLSQITVSYAQGTNTASWLPNPGNTPFKGLVLGSRSSDGQSFVTVGPQVPTFILRDPPGSQSFASLETGSSSSATYSWNVNEELGGNFQKQICVGTEFTAGIGVETPTDIENQISLNTTVETSISQSGSLVETTTFNDSWETSGSTDFVGSEGDIYVGKAMNITFGLSGSVLLLKDSECGLPGMECRSESVNIGGQNYRFGKKVSLSAAPGGYATSFMYTQDHIINTLIPRLKALRNQLFVNKPAIYQSVITDINNAGYGRNNDDPYFGTGVSSTDPLKTEATDTIGLSYHFIAPNTPIIVQVRSTLGILTTDTLPPSMGDSIRWYNQQIRLWEEAIAMNEADKYAALQNPASLKNNYSFSSGVTYTNSTTTENENEFSFEFEVGVTEEAKLKIGAKVGGAGVELEQGLSLKLSGGYGKSESTTQSTTWAFTFLDEDLGDFYSVDVRNSAKGWGPIFNVVAGETSCPWEGNDSSLYFQSGGQNVLLSTGTFHRELAELKVDGSPAYSQQINIPEGSSANYILELINLSESNDDIDYGIKVLTETNPDGAILTIDGYNPSTLNYPVPAGSSLFKTLVLQRGAIAYDYDSIAVVIHSLCDDPAVGDTVYVTAHFLPTCTDVDIASPLNQWVVNNSFNDSLNIVINDYDINFRDLASIGLEFKPSSQAAWIPEQDWYKYVATPGPDSLSISQSSSNTLYRWGLTGLPDGTYDLRVKSQCLLADKYSTVYTGIVDRINPHTFGTPSPADGILDPNDDIFIQLNEPVDIGSINSYNFDVRGVLNGTDVRHSESLNFDGVSDYARVLGGANLQQRSFTVEFWAKLNATGINQTVFSQGTDATQSMSIGFDNMDRFSFRLGNQTVTSNAAIASPASWHHYAAAYDYTNSQVVMYVDGAIVNNGNLSLFFNYTGDGKLAFGTELPVNANYFNGNLHEVRLWNDVRTAGEISSNYVTTLVGNENGLLYNWRMDEAYGSIAEDHVRARNADLYGTTWEIIPNGNAAQFDGTDDYLAVNSSTLAISKEMDFTLEFWFRSTQAGAATLFSNGNGTGTQADSLLSWNIAKDASGIIHVYHYGLDFIATNQNYFDGNWHHFALVMNRNANLSSYIDGNLETSAQAINFQQMGSVDFYLGAHGYYTGALFNVNSFYQGDIDEFRFWNASRKLEQIRRDLRNRMMGDEYALEAFVPFENYQLILGVPTITPTTSDLSVNTNAVVNNGGVTLIAQTPTLKLPRPVQAVPFTFSVNNDKIVITPTASPDLIEKVTLDVTVKNVKDLHGNTMQSPRTWIAFVNKNQVLWQDDMLSFTKTVDSVITFTTYIVNTGGAAKQYQIGGLPTWLSADITSGILPPNSSQIITFTIPSGTTVGTYDADISLTTDFGYDENLRISLKVNGIPPNWSYNPTAFQYNMSLIAEVKIDNVISTNTSSMVAAMINGQIVGVSNIQYVPAYDRYEAFMSIHSNNPSGDSILFNIYDANTGLTFVEVTPHLAFEENTISGSTSAPLTLYANTEISLPIVLNNGWTWVSFPLQTTRLQNANSFMNDVTNTNNDVIRSINAYDQYYSSTGWIGNITSSANHYLNAESYKMKKAVADTLHFRGSRINPDSAIAQINVVPGWNWIGYVSTKTTDVTTALSNYNALNGDIIKSQYEFAYYDSLNGWIGSLSNFYPGRGYMLKSTGTSSFSYPLSTYFGRLGVSGNKLSPSLNEISTFYPFNAPDYEKTMSMIVKSGICPELSSNSNIALGAFDTDNHLRGYATANYNSTNDEYLYFLTLYSNTDSEQLHLNYFNTVNGDIINSTTTINFQTDALMGTPSSPVIAVVDPEDMCTLSSVGIDQLNSAEVNVIAHPNPFKSDFTVSFGKNVDVKIEMIDMLGKVVLVKQTKNQSQVTLSTTQLNLSSGVYSLRITGDLNLTLKIVKSDN
jgi:hypothetical protein